MSFYDEFPTLKAIEMELENEVSQIKAKIDEIKTHPRYDDNESERQYQIEQLEKEYEDTLAAAEEKFQIELEAIELHLAEQTFTMPTVSDEEREQAESLAATVKAQLLTGTNKADVLELLKIRIKTMTDAEKQAVKLAVVSMDIDGLDEVIEALNDTVHMREINAQLDALKRIKISANSIRRKYDTLDNAIQEAFDSPSTLKDEGIGREFYDKYLKGKGAFTR